MSRKFLCPSCKSYTSLNVGEKCHACKVNVSEKKPKQAVKRIKSAEPPNTNQISGQNTSPNNPKKENFFSLDFLSVMLILCLAIMSIYGFQEAGEDGLVKYLMYGVISIGATYFIGKTFGSTDPEKTFSDIFTSGAMRILAVIVIISIPIGFLNMLGIIDLKRNGKCSASSYATNECEPDPSIPSFRWMD